MEKRLFSKFDSYTLKFKTDLQKKILELSFEEKDKTNELLEYLFEYEKFTHTNNKNTQTIPSTTVATTHIVLNDAERCIALRKQGDRCTRKKTNGCDYCGTHYLKNKVTQQEHQENQENQEHQENQEQNEIYNQKKEVIAQEIQGIIYYMDSELNIYNTEDIFKNVKNPRIIAKAIELGTNTYSIPSLGL